VIRISVEVGRSDPQFKTTVEAQSIEQAVSIAGARYPGREIRMLFPIDPEEFFDSGKLRLHDKVEPAVDVGDLLAKLDLG